MSLTYKADVSSVSPSSERNYYYLLHVADEQRKKTCARESRLVLVLLNTDWMKK